MDAATSTAISPWLYLAGGILGGLLSGGGIVAMYRAVLDRRAQQVQLQNTDADTELKRLQQAKTMTEMVSLLTEDLDDALKTQRTSQKDNSERIKAMQIQIEKMSEKCIRVDALEQELKIANEQVERARRDGFIQRDNEGGKGPNPAAGGPNGLLST